MSLACCTVVSDPKTNWFPLYEWLLSVKNIADEIFIVIADKNSTIFDMHVAILAENFSSKEAGETLNIIDQFINEYPEVEGMINYIIVPWSEKLGKWERAGMKNLAIKYVTSDWILFSDVDELLDNHNIEMIRKISGCEITELETSVSEKNNLKFISDDVLAIRFGAIHYYRDLNHVVKYNAGWFESKLLMFRNNRMIHFGTLGDDIDSVVNWDGKDIPPEKIINAGRLLTFHHVGHARPTNIYLRKKNELEIEFHPSYSSTPWKNKDSWEWNMSITDEIPNNWHYPEWVKLYREELQKELGT